MFGPYLIERQIGQGIAVDVHALDDHPEALAGAKTGRGRPELDLDRDDLARAKEVLSIVTVDRLPRRRALLV